MNIDMGRELARLRAENDALRAENAEFRRGSGYAAIEAAIPPEWKLTGVQTRIFAALLMHSRCALEKLIEETRSVEGTWAEDPDPRGIQVQIVRLRAKVGVHGATICNTYSMGYHLENRLEWRKRLGIGGGAA